MNEHQIASVLRNAVEKVHDRVDDVDTFLGNVATFVGGVLEVAKEALVEADKALAEYDKTEEVDLGAKLAEPVDIEDVANDISTEQKLKEIQDNADAYHGVGNHLWNLVVVKPSSIDYINRSYVSLLKGQLF